MASMPHAPNGKLDKYMQAQAVNSVRDQEVEKSRLGSRDSPALPAGRETGSKTVEISEGDGGEEYAESVASECSVESNASSNAPDGEDCGDGGDEAESPSNVDRILKRCTSGGSIVTYDEAGSKLREEGDCERSGSRTIVIRSEGAGGGQFNEFDDDQDISINAGQMITESNGPAWTDDKHCSYLNSMEQTFVQSLLGQDYRTADGSGEDDPDCVESRPMYGNEMFRSLQRGCYVQGEYYRPQFKLNTFGLSTAAVFMSPWIQHFNPRVAAPTHGSAGIGQEAETSNPSAAFVDGAYGPGNFASGDVKEEVQGGVPNLNSPETGLQQQQQQQAPPYWSSRFQSQHHASTSTHVRPDAGVQAKKRNMDPHASTSPQVRADAGLQTKKRNLDPQASTSPQGRPDTGLQAKKRNLDSGSDVPYRPKKLKNTQRLLAAIDLEMEEQFVLKQQQHLKDLAEDSELKEALQSLGALHGGFDLNQELVDEDETKPEDTPQSFPPQAAVTKTTIDFVSHFMEPLSSNKASASESSLEKRPFEPKLCPATFRSSDFGEGSSSVKKSAEAMGYTSPPGLSLKLRQDVANVNHQGDSSFEEEDEFEFLLSRSPRASKTYKWGGAIGPRRLLRNDCNGFVEAGALPGCGVVHRDSKDHELPNKGKCERK